MTLSPSEHYVEADRLLAELELADPQVAPRLPGVQFKLRLAELHAQLAQAPWFFNPGYATADIPPATTRPGPAIETRNTNGDML